MAVKRAELLGKFRELVPPLLGHFHKGQMGRVAIIGGSEEYTGAPYFSAMASARLGCDLSHVITIPEAAQAIKSYSPNLMVHPYLRGSAFPPITTWNQWKDSSLEDLDPNAVELIKLLKRLRLHALVIGPGLGCSPTILSSCLVALLAARSENLPVVLDADGLMIALRYPWAVAEFTECILTPNRGEFMRLAAARNCPLPLDPNDPVACLALAQSFHGPTVIQKGLVDHISNDHKSIRCEGRASMKRSGGQGDTLTGCLATLLAWRRGYLDHVWERDLSGNLSVPESLAVACFASCAITREASCMAFDIHGRSLQASDLTDHLNRAFLNLLKEHDRSFLDI